MHSKGVHAYCIVMCSANCAPQYTVISESLHEPYKKTTPVYSHHAHLSTPQNVQHSAVEYKMEVTSKMERDWCPLYRFWVVVNGFFTIFALISHFDNFLL